MATTKATVRKPATPDPVPSAPRVVVAEVGKRRVSKDAVEGSAESHRGRETDARGTGRVTILNPKTGRATSRTFGDLYRADVLDRIGIIKGGLPATTIKHLAHDMDIATERLTTVLGVATATINRKARAGATLDVDESTRVLGMVRLVGQVEQMVQESGTPDDFNAARWVARWMERPVPALGNARPADFMDTTVGQDLVRDLVAKMQSGAYA